MEGFCCDYRFGKDILPRSAFQPVKNSSVAATGEMPVESGTVRSGSPVVVMVSEQSVTSGPQMVQPSPNITEVQPDSADDQLGSVTSAGPAAHTSQQAQVVTASEPVTLSLPETTPCSPEEEALLKNLDLIDAKDNAESKDQDDVRVCNNAEIADRSNQNVSSETSVAVGVQCYDGVSKPSGPTAAKAACVTKVDDTSSLHEVTKSLGFHPIAPDTGDIIPPILQPTGTQISQQEGQATRPSDTLDRPDTGDVIPHAMDTVDRPSGVQGKSLQADPGCSSSSSRPNSRGAAPSRGGFEPLDRNSPNIFVSFQDNIPPTGTSV